MRRVVIDTNIYVDWINEGRHEVVLFRRDAVRCLSAVVLMELYAGVRSARDRRLIRGIASSSAGSGRLLLPGQRVYEDAGHVLRGLRTQHDYDLAGARALASDVLIALSARSIGATVITQNERDFRAIQRMRRFTLEVVREAVPAP